MASGTRNSKERRAQKRDAMTAKLLAGVERLLAEGNSYTDLSIDDIVTASDVPRSTLYYYYRDKGELLLAISESALEEILEASRGFGELDPNLSRNEFLATVTGALETWLPHVPITSAMAELAAYNPEVEERFRAGWAVIEQRIADHITEGQAAGRIRGALRAKEAAPWLIWMLERGMSQAVGPELDATRTAQLIEQAAEILHSALYGE